jgi:hypothetical protein
MLAVAYNIVVPWWVVWIMVIGTLAGTGVLVFFLVKRSG